MKKVLSLFMLLCMGCMGVWAGVVKSNTPTAVENLSATKLYAIYVKQCYKANTNAGDNATNVGYLYKHSTTGTRVQATSDFQTDNPLPGAWILTRNSEGGITLRNGYQSKLINVFDLKSSTSNESGFDIGDTAGKYKAVGSAADGYTLQGYDGTNYESPNKAWLNYNTSNGLWVAYAANRAAKFQFFELTITDDNALTEQYIPDGYYYIRTYNDAMYDTFQPYVTDNGSTMRLTAKSSLSNNVGIWHITQVATTEGNYAYKIRSVQNPENYWTHGPYAPMSESFAKYAITYDNNRKAYRFNGHSTEGNIQNKKCVTPKSATEFERAREASAATDADFYELIPTDAVYEVTYNITASNAAGDQISWSEHQWVVGSNASAGLAQLSYDFFSNFKISDANTTVDEDHTTFNVTATHTLPIVPGKFYLLKNRHKDNHVAVDNNEKTYARSTRNMDKANYLWSFERVENTPNQFYLKNLALDKYLTGTSGVVSYNATKTNAYTIWKDTQTNTDDGFCLHLSSSNSTNDVCVGSHAAGSGLDTNFPNTVHTDGYASLSIWTRGRDGGARKDNGSIFWVEEFDESIFTTTSKYVGDLAYNSTETFETYLGSKTATNLKAALNYYNDANNKHAITIDADKYYVIESAKNSKIRIYIDDLTAHKFCYAAIEDHMLPGIFRFTSKSTENSNNWGESKECDTYKIYCVGATQKGYMGWGTYNDQVVNANVDDAAVVKVVSVGNASTFQLSSYDAVRDDNCTYAIGNNKTSVADNETGSLVSWNMYNSTNCNVWKIREVEAPAVPTQSVTITAAGAATFYTGKTLEIPAGVTAKILADDTTKDNGNGVYHLTYTALEDEIPAGTAVVLTGDATTYQFPRSLEPHDYVETSAAASDQNRLIGTLASDVEATGHGEEGTLYALGNNPDIAGVAFYHFLGETLTAGKAYLDASGLVVSGGDARAFAIFDEEGEQTTNINGLFIEAASNAAVYDLAGRRINANTKGISIVNGKKVIR